MKKLIHKALWKVAQPIIRIYRAKKIANFIDSGLPSSMQSVLMYLINESPDTSTTKVIEKAERRRKIIASGGDKKVPIWYSPKSKNTANSVQRDDTRPEPGEVLEFTMEKVANTGKNQKWGVALYLIAREFHSTTVVELGTCAGISAMYLSSPPTVNTLVTVEGSEALAKIARDSLHEYPNAKVVNSLFDEAIESEVPLLNEKVDLAYIDGHHEKTATIHYFDRLVPYLKPGGVIIFDDISWSQDMREAWYILSKRNEFSHAMDVGAIGVCIMKENLENLEGRPKYWPLQSVVGRHTIGEPHGWQ